MAKETTTQATGTEYAIDLNWYEEGPRSFIHAVRTSLCAKCQRKIEGKDISPRKIIGLIKGCCSGETDFINDRQPILESIFRVFLSNGNEPMGLEELSRLLSEQRGGDSTRTAPQILSRLLRKEDYYGIRPSPTS
jgi:hypothetical protein